MSPSFHTIISTFQYLSNKFSDSLFARSFIEESDPSLQTECFWTDGSTRFFLDITEKHECSGVDFYVLTILSMGVFIVSWLPRWLLYEPLANHLRRTRSLKWTQEKAERFSQSVAACSFHIIMAVFAWSVLKRKDWLYDKGAWVENLHGDNLIEPDFKFYYLLYAARYVSDLVSMHYEHKTKDSVAYKIHHIATIVLVLLSARVGCTRIGGVIMFFFDWADPPMLLAKAMVYLSLDANDVYQKIADMLMGVFVVSFVATRNIAFTAILYIAVRECPNTSELLVLKAMLLVLFGLMTFWLALIAKALHHQFFKNDGHVDDIRENHDYVQIRNSESNMQKTKQR